MTLIERIEALLVEIQQDREFYAQRIDYGERLELKLMLDAYENQVKSILEQVEGVQNEVQLLSNI